jgi:hypothetical protein
LGVALHPNITDAVKLMTFVTEHSVRQQKLYNHEEFLSIVNEAINWKSYLFRVHAFMLNCKDTPKGILQAVYSATYAKEQFGRGLLTISPHVANIVSDRSALYLRNHYVLHLRGLCEWETVIEDSPVEITPTQLFDKQVEHIRNMAFNAQPPYKENLSAKKDRLNEFAFKTFYNLENMV